MEAIKASRSALRHKQALSSLRPTLPPPPPSRRQASAPDTYILEWSSHARHRHALATPEEIRSEILAGDDSDLGMRRLLVVRGSVDGDVGCVLRDVGGVGEAFLRAHAEGRGGRGRGRWWSWGVAERGGRKREGGFGGKEVIVGRASLWLSSSLPILLVNKPPSSPLQTPTPPKLHHQDAATNPFSLQPSGLYGAFGIHAPQDGSSASLEEDLWDILDVGTSIEDVLGELIRDRWVDFVDGVKPRRAVRNEDNLLWSAMKALEQNLDMTRDRQRQGVELESVTVEDWRDLLERVQRRIQIFSLGQSPPSSANNRGLLPDGTPPPLDKDVNERSLDRIAYLGGILLPVTVVSGVLAIEGDYGPQGGNFWVFWVASLILSVIALMVIYVDQVRSLEVWIEVAAGDAVDAIDTMLDDCGDDGVESDARKDPDGASQSSTTYLVREEGGRARTWQRRELGWGGAVKRISGYDRMRMSGAKRSRGDVAGRV